MDIFNFLVTINVKDQKHFVHFSDGSRGGAQGAHLSLILDKKEIAEGTKQAG